MDEEIKAIYFYFHLHIYSGKITFSSTDCKLQFDPQEGQPKMITRMKIIKKSWLLYCITNALVGYSLVNCSPGRYLEGNDNVCKGNLIFIAMLLVNSLMSVLTFYIVSSSQTLYRISYTNQTPINGLLGPELFTLMMNCPSSSNYV